MSVKIVNVTLQQFQVASDGRDGHTAMDIKLNLSGKSGNGRWHVVQCTSGATASQEITPSPSAYSHQG